MKFLGFYHSIVEKFCLKMPGDRKRKVVERAKPMKSSRFRVNDDRNEDGPGNQGKQTRSRSKSSKNDQTSNVKVTRTVATFQEEDGNIVEMTAEGQSTDFVSEEELDQNDSEVCPRSEFFEQESLDLEVSFKNCQANNNATVSTQGTTKIQEDQARAGCSSDLSDVEKMAAAKAVAENVQDAISQSLDKSLTKLQNYFDRRLAYIEKAVDLDRGHSMESPRKEKTSQSSTSKAMECR